VSIRLRRTDGADPRELLSQLLDIVLAADRALEDAEVAGSIGWAPYTGMTGDPGARR
jgi:hypothetical protein